MIKLVWRTDAHLADHPPQSRIDDWTSTILGKLAQVGDIATKVGAVAVLDGGDSFHVKSPVRNTHELMQRVAGVHQKYPCPVWSNVGNHDVKYGDIRNLNQSPLGVLFKTGVYHRLYDGYEALFEDEKSRMKVRVVGIPYHSSTYDMNRFTTITKGDMDEDYLVVVAHCLASAEDYPMFVGEDIIPYKFLADLDPDVWCFGHWHQNQGVQEIRDGKWVVNIGGLSRGVFAQQEMKRIPSCAVLSFGSKVDIEVIPLDVRPAEEVFDVAGRARVEANAMVVETFIDDLQKTLDPGSSVPLEDQIRDSDAPAEVKERALSYLENV